MSNAPSPVEGWTVYDELGGPDLDPGLWKPLDFGFGARSEPGAQTTVAAGTVTIDIPRFTVSDDSNQGLDNTKHVIFTTQGVTLDPWSVRRGERVGSSATARRMAARTRRVRAVLSID
jgi:hypothetical protein